MSVSIVPIALSHAESFHACLDAVAREKRFLAQTKAAPLERVTEFVQSSVSSNAAQLVALEANRVVGWADVFPSWADAISHCGQLGMGVVAEYRGQGIGRRLIDQCIAKAWQRGITRIELEVRTDNERAIHLYERVGFSRESTKRRAMRFDGIYYDAFQMVLFHDAA
jgi:ribosomal protein S18 acetylase RimI-like enzyme